MNPRTVLLILAALGAAGGTGLYAKKWILAERATWASQQPEDAPQKTAAVMVLVAKKALTAGSFVQPADLEWKPWPEDGLIDGYLVKDEETKKTVFDGAVVRSSIAAGEPITEARLVQPGERGFLAAVLKPGNRAVSIPINATTGISGFVFPGDSVDVLMTSRLELKRLTGEEQGNEPKIDFSETLVSNIRVLALDQRVENTEGSPLVAKTATVEVTPKQAEMIALGLRVGSLSLSLHSLAKNDATDGDRFSQVAAAIGADPEAARAKTDAENSYTLEFEILNVLRDPRFKKQQQKKRERTVNVLRADKAEQAKF